MSARSLDDQLATLEKLKHAPAAEAIDPLRSALQSKSNILIAKAAAVAAALKLATLTRDLAQSFERFLHGEDKGCIAKTAIVKSLAVIEADEDAVFVAGARHVQMEGGFGRPRDAGIELRCESVAALVRKNSRQMWDPLVRLLADESEDARCAAARALAATGHDHAKLLLRFKILTGDKEPAVMAECFSAIVALTRSIDLVSPFLDSEDDALREAAVMALGESRLSAAFETLSQMNASAFGDDFRRLLFLAIAMTRQPQAIDFLLAQLKQSKQHRQHAIEALALYRSDSAVRSRVESAVRDAGEKLLPIFHKHFGG